MKPEIDSELKQKSLQPKWPNAPTVSDLRNDLKNAEPAHVRQKARIDDWLDHLYVRGKAAQPVTPGRSSITPMLIRKHAEWRYASLSEPLHTAATLFTTKPVSPEDGPVAAQDGAVLNHQFGSELDMTAILDEAVRVGTGTGTTVYKVGWEILEEERKVKIPVFTDGEVSGEAEQLQDVVVYSRPTVEVVDHRNVILDPTARGIFKNSKFIIYKYLTNKAEMKADGFSNLEHIDLENNTGDSTDSQDSYSSSYDGYSSRGTGSVASEGAGREDADGFRFEDDSRKEVTAYEYWGFWDINGDGILVPIQAVFVKDVMVKLDYNPYPHRRLPFVLSKHLPVVGHNYGEPDGSLLIDNQRIAGAVTRSMIDILGRSAAGQEGHAMNALDPVNELKFNRGEKYRFRDGIDPTKAFHMHVHPEIPQSAYSMLTMQEQGAEGMTGIQTYGEGVTGSGLGNTAAGVNGALSAAAKRESGILRRYAKGLEEVAILVSAMNEVFLEPEAVTRITGKEYVQPQPGLRTTDVRVKIRTAEEDNQLASDMAFLGQTTEDPGLRQILSAKVADLKNMPDIAEEIRNYEPKPDPMALEIQQLEKQLLEAQIANELAKAKENDANGVLDYAKAQTEVAKAENLQSQTDLNTLEHVEEETGVNHERAKELQKQQAEGNMHLEVLKKTTTEIAGE